MLSGSQQTTKRLTVAMRRWLRLMFLLSSSNLLLWDQSLHQTNIELSISLTSDMIFLCYCETRYVYEVVRGSWRKRRQRPGRAGGTGRWRWRFQTFSCWGRTRSLCSSPLRHPQTTAEEILRQNLWNILVIIFSTKILITRKINSFLPMVGHFLRTKYDKLFWWITIEIAALFRSRNHAQIAHAHCLCFLGWN